MIAQHKRGESLPARESSIATVMEGFHCAHSKPDAKMASAVFEAFGRLAEDPAFSAELERAGAAESFVNALRANEADNLSTLMAMITVGRLGLKHSSWKAPLARAGIFPRILAFLSHRDGRTETLKRACGALLSIGVLDTCAETRASMRSAGFAGAAVAALERWKGNAAAVAEICTLVQHSSNDDACCADLARAGVVPVLIAVLHKHGSNLAVAQPSCSGLDHLARDADGRAAIMARDGAGLAALISALRLHEADTLVVSAVLNGMANLLDDASASCAVVRAGGLPPVARALQAHKGNGAIADRCFIVLSLLQEQAGKEPDFQRALKSEPCLAKDVIVAVRTHARRLVLALPGAASLTHLCKAASEAGTLPALIRDGAVQAFAAVIKEQPPGSMAVVAAASGMLELAKGAARSPETAAELARAAATAVAVAALRAGLRGGRTDAITYSASALSCLMCIPGAAPAAARLGAAADLVAAISRWASSEWVVTPCSAALTEIAKFAETAPDMQRCGAAEALLSVLRTGEGASTASMVIMVCFALSKPGFEGASVTAGAAAALVKCLRTHQRDAAAATAVLLALQNLASSSESNTAHFLREVRGPRDKQDVQQRYRLSMETALLLPPWRISCRHGHFCARHRVLYCRPLIVPWLHGCC